MYCISEKARAAEPTRKLEYADMLDPALFPVDVEVATGCAAVAEDPDDAVAPEVWDATLDVDMDPMAEAVLVEVVDATEEVRATIINDSSSNRIWSWK